MEGERMSLTACEIVLCLPGGRCVWEKVPVCLPRDGNETGRWETIWLTGRDGSGSKIIFGGIARDRTGSGNRSNRGTGRGIGRGHSWDIARE